MSAQGVRFFAAISGHENCISLRFLRTLRSLRLRAFFIRRCLNSDSATN